jgi:hypothetical protein
MGREFIKAWISLIYDGGTVFGWAIASTVVLLRTSESVLIIVEGFKR